MSNEQSKINTVVNGLNKCKRTDLKIDYDNGEPINYCFNFEHSSKRLYATYMVHLDLKTGVLKSTRSDGEKIRCSFSQSGIVKLANKLLAIGGHDLCLV